MDELNITDERIEIEYPAWAFFCFKCIRVIKGHSKKSPSVGFAPMTFWPDSRQLEVTSPIVPTRLRIGIQILVSKMTQNTTNINLWGG